MRGATSISWNIPEVNTVVSIAGSGFPINANDAIWAKYKLARALAPQRQRGQGRCAHNVFLEAPAGDTKRASVKELQARGTIFTQCNNALKAIAKEFAMASHDAVDKVYDGARGRAEPGRAARAREHDAGRARAGARVRV